MGKKKIFLLLPIAAALGLAYYLLPSSQPIPEAPPVQAVTVAPAPEPVPAPLPPSEIVERYPLAVAQQAPSDKPQSDINQSDGVYRDAFGLLFGKETIAEYFYPDRMIRRFVATIDNLPRHEAPAEIFPVKPVGGPFLVKQIKVKRKKTSMQIAPENDQRYLRHLDLLTTVNPRRLVDTYIALYPLFQRAYRELGYPQGHFNDRLVETLDDLLATPEVAPPIPVQQPKVLYTYADPELEARSAGQKIMLRLGADNTVRAKQALSTIRTELLSRSPKRP